MGVIQELNYKKGKTEYTKYSWNVPKELIRAMAIQKGDHFFYNGAMGNEIRVILKRKAEIEADKINSINTKRDAEIEKVKN